MSRCYFCGASDVKIPNSKITIKGKKNKHRVQKTIRICNCCWAWKTYEEIYQEISETFEWDYIDESGEMHPSAENGDYSPSCPWNAPGMSVKDFI